MKKTFRKNIIREITKSLSRFMAILSIVALGVGFLAGLMATTPDMRISADKYYDDTNTTDIRVISTLGLTGDDVDSIRNIDGVLNVMPAYSADALLSGPLNETLVTKIQSIPLNDENYQNQLVLVEGRLPENKGECVIVDNGIMSTALTIGDKLKATDENINIEDKLNVGEFEVVGIVENAYYFSGERERSTVGNGSVGLIIYTVEDSFSYDVFTEIFLTVNGAKELDTFSTEYDDLITATIDEIEEISNTQTQIRYEEVIIEANEKLSESRKEYDDKKAETEQELNEALDKINEGKKEVANAKNEISNGYEKLNNGKEELNNKKLDFNKTIEEKKLEISKGKKQIEDSRLELAGMKQQLDEASGRIEEIRPLASTNPEIAQEVANYDANVLQYNTSVEELNAKEQELKNGEKELQYNIDEANKEFESAQKELALSEAKLVDAQSELNTAEKDLNKGIKEYNDGKIEADEKLADAEKKLSDAENDINSMEVPEWYVLDRHSNLGFESFYSNTEKVEAIAKVFPIFFFLVAALVALTTMTRMVEEERTQIGVLKALGYSKLTIASKYILYAGLASILGSVLGLSIGLKLFPHVIWNAYEMMYSLPPLITEFNAKFSLIASIAAIMCTLAATIFACYSSLVECPARLMLPKAPKAGKRVFLEYITPVWKRMKFTHKVTARNLIRYKKRFFMTVIGIAGCTALLVTGFGLRDSISDIISKQFDELFNYNLMVSMKDQNAIEKSDNLKEIFNDKNIIEKYTTIHQETATATGDKNNKSVITNITCIEDASELSNFITLRDRKTKEAVEFNENSVVVTEKLAKTLNLKVGDNITLENGDNKRADFSITGITENYVTGYVYIADELYEKAYNKDLTFNMLIGNMLDITEEQRNEVSTSILKEDDINAVNFTDTLKDDFDDLLGNIDYIIVVLIVSAGLLAFIVLYNLTNINITERQKEIATIKVLGFYDKEVSSYIYRETMILSMIGTAVGLIFGIFLHAFVVQTAEVDMVMFGRDIYPLSYAFSAILTMFFSVLVNLVMNKKLKNIDMVESMKANE